MILLDLSGEKFYLLPNNVDVVKDIPSECLETRQVLLNTTFIYVDNDCLYRHGFGKDKINELEEIFSSIGLDVTRDVVEIVSKTSIELELLSLFTTHVFFEDELYEVFKALANKWNVFITEVSNIFNKLCEEKYITSFKIEKRKVYTISRLGEEHLINCITYDIVNKYLRLYSKLREVLSNEFFSPFKLVRYGIESICVEYVFNNENEYTEVLRIIEFFVAKLITQLKIVNYQLIRVKQNHYIRGDLWEELMFYETIENPFNNVYKICIPMWMYKLIFE